MPFLQAILQIAIVPLKLIAQGLVLILDRVKFVTAGIEGFFSAFKAIVGGIGSILSSLFGGNVKGAVNEALSLGQKTGEAFMQGYQDSLSKKEIEDAVKDLNDAVEKAGKVKQKSQAIDSIEELIQKYKSATDEVDR